MAITRATFLRQLVLGTVAVGAAPMRTVGAWIRAPHDGPRKPFPHPEPRPGITGDRVLPERELPDKRAVRQWYAAARAHPATFDGLYCTCRCERSHGHRSLLSCFETDQPVGCFGCQEEAEFVVPLVNEGKSLAEIRAAVDEKFG
jgi:hypothetical protein